MIEQQQTSSCIFACSMFASKSTTFLASKLPFSKRKEKNYFVSFSSYAAPCIPILFQHGYNPQLRINLQYFVKWLRLMYFSRTKFIKYYHFENIYWYISTPSMITHMHIHFLFIFGPKKLVSLEILLHLRSSFLCSKKLTNVVYSLILKLKHQQ